MQNVLAIGAWCVFLLWLGWLLYTAFKMKIPADRRRHLRRSVYPVFILWVVVGLFLLSPLLRFFPLFLRGILAPFDMTLYPAAPLAAFLQARLVSLFALPFFVWQIISTVFWTILLWSPLLVLHHPRVPIALGLFLFVVFWIAIIGGYLYFSVAR